MLPHAPFTAPQVPIGSAWRTSFRLMHRDWWRRSTTCPRVMAVSAGAMPKAASAAYSQALQCAAAIGALLEDRQAPVAELDSVCYSLLSPATALAMHGRFQISGDRIEQIEGGNRPEKHNHATPAHVSEASAWYQSVRAQCFGV